MTIIAPAIKIPTAKTIKTIIKVLTASKKLNRKTYFISLTP